MSAAVCLAHRPADCAPGVRSGGTPERRCSSRLNEASDHWRWFKDDGEGQHDQRFQRVRTRSWFVLGARHSSMGDGSYLYFIRNTEIHAAVRTRHCPLHFQQSVRLVAVYLRGQGRGLSARHHRVNDGRSSRGWRIHPDSIGTRLIAGNRYVCDYLVVFLLDTRCRQVERIHGPHSVEPHRGIPLQRHRPSLCLCCLVFSIAAEGSRPAPVELISSCPNTPQRDCRFTPKSKMSSLSAFPAVRSPSERSFPRKRN